MVLEDLFMALLNILSRLGLQIPQADLRQARAQPIQERLALFADWLKLVLRRRYVAQADKLEDLVSSRRVFAVGDVAIDVL